MLVKKKWGKVLPFPALPSPPLISLPPSLPHSLSHFLFFFPKDCIQGESTLARTATGDCSLPIISEVLHTSSDSIHKLLFNYWVSKLQKCLTFKLEADLHACGRQGKGENTVT